MKIDVSDRIDIAAVDFEDGQKILHEIRPIVQDGQHVELDFQGVKIFASPFFNGSVAILVNEMGPDVIDRFVTMAHLNAEGELMAKRSIENAKAMKDPERQKRLAEALEEED